MNVPPVATSEELEDAATDRARVFLRGRQLRRRRWWLWGGGLAAAIVAVVAVSLTLADQGSGPAQVVVGPDTPTGLPPTGHQAYFRPVICEILPARTAGTGSAPLSEAAAAAECSSPEGASLADTAPGTERASEYVILPASWGSVRYVLGPADLDTGAIASARAVAYNQRQSWGVEVTFTTGGAGQFDLVASKRYPYYQQNPTNPPYASLEAFEVNGTVIAAPTIQSETFNGTVELTPTGATPYSRQQAGQLVQAIQYDITHQ